MSDIEARIVDAIHWVHLPKGGIEGRFVQLDANAAHAVAKLLAPMIREAQAEAWQEGTSELRDIYGDLHRDNPYRSNDGGLHPDLG